MNQSQSIKRSLGDKLLILGAHCNAHPELPEPAYLRPDYEDELSVQLSDGSSALLAWASTLTGVTWKAGDFRDPKWQQKSWHVYASGAIATMPVTAWGAIPGDYADTAEAVIAKLTAESRETTAMAGASQ